MNNFIFIVFWFWIWLQILHKMTTDASPVAKLSESSKIAPVSSRAYPFMAGPPLNSAHCTLGRMKKIVIGSDELPSCGGCGTQECVYVKDKTWTSCWFMTICTKATLLKGDCTLCRNAIDETFCTPMGITKRCLLEESFSGPTKCVTCNKTCESGQVCTFNGGMQECTKPTKPTDGTTTTPRTTDKGKTSHCDAEFKDVCLSFWPSKYNSKLKFIDRFDICPSETTKGKLSKNHGLIKDNDDVTVSLGKFSGYKNGKKFPNATMLFFNGSSKVGFRKDLKCGPDYILTGCDPYGKYPCCNRITGRCGNTDDDCTCDNCFDYRNAKLRFRSDYQCGSDFNAGCDPDGIYPCCKMNKNGKGLCGITDDHCKCDSCVDYRRLKLTTFRNDLHCGPYYDNAGCDPYGDYPCCSWNNGDGKGWCGVNKTYCDCNGNPNHTCVNFIKAPFGYRKDNKCGRFNGFDIGCDPYGEYPCCNFKKGYCGNDADYCKCTTCMDYRNGMAGKDDRRSSEVTLKCARRDYDKVLKVEEPKPGYYHATVAAKCACECDPPCDKGKVCVKGECKGWPWLNGQCFTYQFGQLSYHICPFGENIQTTSPNHKYLDYNSSQNGTFSAPTHHKYSMGKFTEWKDGIIGELMLFDHGDSAHCNKRRKSEISFFCQDSNQVRLVYENDTERCNYHIQMETPLACIGWPSLRGQCFYHTNLNLNYQICPYGYNYQGQQKLNIGEWIGWKDNKQGGVMLFANGDDYNCNIKRKSKIEFSCGDSDKILQVLEPRICHYHIRMQTPLACAGLEQEKEQEQVKEEQEKEQEQVKEQEQEQKQVQVQVQVEINKEEEKEKP